MRLPGLGRLVAKAIDESLDMRAFGGLFAGLGRDLGRLGPTLCIKRVVVALIERQISARQVQDCPNRPVEQLPVVADHQHGMRIAGQVGFQPDRAFQIQVVRRLVQQQHIGFRKQHRSQRHTHSPTAREISARAGLGRTVKAQAGQDRAGARLGRMGPDIDKPGLDFGNSGGIGCRVGLGQQRGAFGIGGQHGGQQAGIAGRGLLIYTTDPGASGHLDLAAIQRQLAPDQPEQSRFARPVSTNESDLVAGRYRRGRALEQRLALHGERDVADTQHDPQLPRGDAGVN